MHTALHAELAGHAKTRILFLDSDLQEAKAWKEKEDYHFDKVPFTKCFKSFTVILAVIQHLGDSYSSNFIFSKRILREWNDLQSDFDQSIDFLPAAFIKEFETLRMDLQGIILNNLMHISTIVENNHVHIKYGGHPILKFLEDTTDFSSSVIYLTEQSDSFSSESGTRLTTEKELEAVVIEMNPAAQPNLPDQAIGAHQDLQAVAGETPTCLKKKRSPLGIKKPLISFRFRGKPKVTTPTQQEAPLETMPPATMVDPQQEAPLETMPPATMVGVANLACSIS